MNAVKSTNPKSLSAIKYTVIRKSLWQVHSIIHWTHLAQNCKLSPKSHEWMVAQGSQELSTKAYQTQNPELPLPSDKWEESEIFYAHYKALFIHLVTGTLGGYTPVHINTKQSKQKIRNSLGRPICCVVRLWNWVIVWGLHLADLTLALVFANLNQWRKFHHGLIMFILILYYAV